MKKVLLLALFADFLLFPEVISAHAFGIQYTLPIPLSLYLWGGAAAVILSFIIVGLFLNPKSVLTYPKFNLSRSRLFTFLVSPAVGLFFRFAGFFLFLITIATGLFGTNQPLLNFNMTFFWIIFLLGLTYLSALFGNIWPVINPWATLVELLEKLIHKEFKGIFTYPKSLGYFPALIFYFFLIFTELISRVGPFGLSLRILIYTFISIVLAFLFGKEAWLKYCEFFSLFFGLIAKASPLNYDGKSLHLRPPFIGLTGDRADHFSLIPFIVFMLSSTAFDGFHSTAVWFRWEFKHLENLEQIWGGLGFTLVQSLALILVLGFFLLLYLGLILLMKVLTKTPASVRQLSMDFAYSLIPIALVYNIAHYYTLLLVQGQIIISLVSDPFGFGWNLFGTSDFVPNIAILGAKFIWNSQVGFILLGHISAVYLAHLVALKIFPNQKWAVLSQLPMLFLMVCYTVAGLWILAQPLTGG